MIDDDEVSNNKGIFEYLLDGNEAHLNLRTFDDKMKRKKYQEQNGKYTYSDANDWLND